MTGFASLGGDRFVLAIGEDMTIHDDRIVRARLPLRAWRYVAPVALDDFNARLRDLGQREVKRWPKLTPIDRLLGRELCVLAWGCERADHYLDTDCDVLGHVAARWAKLRPEERWWLFAQAAGECGADTEEDSCGGWRRAIRAALGGVA